MEVRCFMIYPDLSGEKDISMLMNDIYSTLSLGGCVFVGSPEEVRDFLSAKCNGRKF